MSQSWAGKIKSAIEGMVDGADARARLASTASLASLRQQIADRRLDAELAHIDAPWRVPFALAPIAAPLWLAESLVTLAQSFGDAESEAHPDRPAMMFALTHGQILVLLEPVDLLQGDISGILADPNRRPALPLPQVARPFAHTNAGLLTDRIPVPYARGLLAGALSIAGSTHLLVDDYRKLFKHASAPAWLNSGLTTIDGDIAAAQTRLDAADLRASPVLRQSQPDQAALRDLVVDLWDLANTYLKVGQLVSAPTLLPGAQPLPGSARAVAQVASAPISTAVPAAPMARPISEAPRPSAPDPIAAMPAIGGPPSRPATPPAVRMPEIGGRPPASASNVLSPSAARMPVIGAASPSAGDSTGSVSSTARVPAVDGVPPSPGPAATVPRQMPSISARSDLSSANRNLSPPKSPGNMPDQPRSMPQIGARSDAAPGPQRDVPPVPSRTTPVPPARAGRRIDRKDRWLAGAQAARYRLRAAGQEDQAEAQLAAFWAAKDWSLTDDERRYLDQVVQFVKTGAIVLSGRSRPEPPFPPIYRVGNAQLQLLDRALRPGTLFSYDFQPGGKGLVCDLPPQAGIQDTP